jgi:hypothetical protein
MLVVFLLIARSFFAVVLLHKPYKPYKPPPNCDFLIKLDRMHSLIAHFQDLSKDHTLVMVCVLELTKTQTTLVKPEVRKVDHQKTRPISVEPKQGPTAAVGVTTERSFLDQGQSQRLSRLENMLEKVMMMLILRQPTSFAQAASGWPPGTLESRGALDKTS